MTLTGITALAFDMEEVLYSPEFKMPYQNNHLGINWRTRLTSPDYELWSIGMMVLETIVGSELVLLLDTYEAVEALIEDVRGHMPMVTHQLLVELLFHVKDEYALMNAKRQDFKIHYLIEEAIVGLEKAKKGNKLLQQRMAAFKAFALENEEELASRFNWKLCYANY